MCPSDEEVPEKPKKPPVQNSNPPAESGDPVVQGQ